MEAMAAERLLLCRFDEGLVGVIRDGESGFFFRSEEDFGEMVKKIRSLSTKEIRNILDLSLIHIFLSCYNLPMSEEKVSTTQDLKVQKPVSYTHLDVYKRQVRSRN